MNERDYQLLAARRSCALLSREDMLAGKVPTTGTSASIIAAMQVQEAVKLLHRDLLGDSFAGKGFVVNGMTHDSYTVTYPRREDCLSHDEYELEQAQIISREMSFAEIVEQARTSLSGELVIELEHDVLFSLNCNVCGTQQQLRVPITMVTASAAICPACGGQRLANTQHAISAQDSEMTALSPAALSLPPADVVTVRNQSKRLHFILDDPQPWSI